MASHTRRLHNDRVRAALPTGLDACLDQLTPVPTTHRNHASRSVGTGETVGLEALNRHLSGRPATTRRAYLADWRRWCTWCELNNRTPLPASSDDLALYFASASLESPGSDQPTNSASTVVRWSGAIAAAHTAHGLPTPTTQSPTSTVLSALRKLSSTRTLTSRFLTDEELARLLEALPPDVWPEAATRRRDRLILTLGRATGLPPDALLDLRVNAVHLEGDTGFLRVDTGDESLHGDVITCGAASCAWCAFTDWRALLDIADTAGTPALEQEFPRLAKHSANGGDNHPADPPIHRTDAEAWLFRRLHRGGSISTARPSAQTVKRLVQTYAEAAGIGKNGLTAFSLRDEGRV